MGVSIDTIGCFLLLISWYALIRSSSRSIAAGRLCSFLDKRTKIKSAERLLCRTCLALQNRENHGLQYFCPCCRFWLTLQQKFANALAAAQASLFSLFSFEAFLLTGTNHYTLHHAIARNCLPRSFGEAISTLNVQ
jgi:hypothetical protein